MSKLVVLRLGEGSVEQGFPVTLQIGEEGARPTTEITGKLPPDPELPVLYQHWQTRYRELGLRSRLFSQPNPVTHVSTLKDCEAAAQQLRDRFNQWLQADSLRSIREKWLEKLLPSDTIRVIVQSEDYLTQKLPWHLWELLDRYPHAEIALSAPAYEQQVRPTPTAGQVKILAILGNREGIDTEADRALLNRLPHADVHWLIEPQRQDLTDQLWSQSWDILFFAGHSATQADGTSGYIAINPTDRLTINELKYGLRKALASGLQLAIFNSCDGLGLARELADLHIPQIIVMREPVPDRVAQTFLTYFLAAFAHNEPLYLAVRQARERLQGLEDQFPCATWLPVLCQNPAETPPTWLDLQGGLLKREATWPQTLRRVVKTSVLATALLAGVRYLGVLQPLELQAFDQLQQLQPSATTDPRLVIIAIDDEDIQQQQRGKGSLSDSVLAQLLSKLESYAPRVIGLDVYRDFPVEPGQTRLANQLKQNQTIVAVCKASDPVAQVAGVAPPPEVPVDRLGFSDFLEDSDGVVRRQLLYMNPDPSSACATPYALSTQLAFRYLAAEGITPSFTPTGVLQLGQMPVPTLKPHTGGYQGLDARGGQLLLRYRTAPQAIAQISLRQLLNGSVNASALKNRVVLIGVVAKSASDYWATPYGKSATAKVPGVWIQAQMVSQLLSAVLDHRSLLWTWAPPIEVGWIGLWAFIGGALSGWIKSRHGWLAATIGAIGGLSLLCIGLLTVGGWVPWIPPTLALVATGAIVRWQPSAPRHQSPMQPLASSHSN